jgi:NTE family protein
MKNIDRNKPNSSEDRSSKTNSSAAVSSDNKNNEIRSSKKNVTETKRALVFSGGGGRGGYEIGIWQAIRELKIPIHIAVGTSVGAINACMVVTDDFEEMKHIWEDVETNMIFDLDNESRYNDEKTEIVRTTRDFRGLPVAEALSFAKYTVTQGGAGSKGLQSIISEHLDVEKFYDSPIEYGLVTAQLPSFKGHYLFKEDIPKDKIGDYVLASASCFPMAQYTEIDGMKLVDGGFADNLPVEMALKKGATEIIAVNLEAVGNVRKDTIEQAKKQADKFIYITSKWDLGNFLCFDPETNIRNMELGHLDGLKVFGKLDGIWYTFEKGSLPAKAIRRADCAARVFELDPLIIYNRQSLNAALLKKIRKSEQTRKEQKQILTKPVARRLSGTAAGDLAATLRNAFSPDILTVIIAQDFKEKEGNSAFLNKHLISRFNTEIHAASYIKGEGLI